MMPAPPSVPGGLRLCAAGDLPERGKAWVWDVLEHGRALRAFALRHGGRVHAYLNRCAHVAAEMDWQPGEFLDHDKAFIVCSLHGASYAPASGHCAGGPCGRGRLTPVAVAECAGEVYWYPSRDIRPAPERVPGPASLP